MTAVPDGWEQHTPHEISGLEKRALVIGPFGSNLKTSDYRDEGVPLVFVKDIRARNFSSPRAYVSTVKAAELGVHEVQPGDILITKMGEPPGDVALYDADVPGIITADCIRLRPASGFDCRFLLHAFRTPDVRRQVNEITTGAAQQKVSLDRFRTRLHISAPPLAEQKRIAAVLDQVDILRAKRREAITLLDDLAQSIFLDMFGDPVSNPNKLPVMRLTDACQCHSGGTPSKSDPSNWSGDLPWFSAKDMKKTDLFSSRDFINSNIPDRTALKLLPKDTVAIVVRGMILAHSFPVCVLRVPATINQDLKALLPKVDLDAQFLATCLRVQKEHVLQQVSQAAHGTTRLDSEGLSNIRVLLPSRSEQDDFSCRIKKAQKLRQEYEEHLVALDELFESLQQRAFSGKLWDHEAA